MELLLDICFLSACRAVQEGKHWKLVVTSLSKTKVISQRFFPSCSHPLFIFQQTFPNSMTAALVSAG